LSPQQQGIYRLLSQGLSRQKVAKTLGISVNTVKVQNYRIKQKQSKMGVNKNEREQPSQYPSALLENPPGAPEECETSNLIRDLESSKGLSLTPLQKKVILMKSVGKGTRTIAEEFGITPGEVQANIEQAAAEIRRIQFSDGCAPDIGACEFIGGNRTVNEVQVLSCLSKGMSVKGTADKLGKTENSVRVIMHRSGISLRALKEQRKSGPRFKNNHYSPPNADALALLWKYHSGMLTPQEKVEAEIILRSEGLIRSVPSIMKNNGRLISMLNAQKRKKVFHVTQEGEARLKKSMSGMKGNILDYSGASIILVNRYAKEESECYGTIFTYTYAVDHRFWPVIQAAAGSVPTPVSERESGLCQPEGSVGQGSCVLLRDVDTNETFLVCMSGAQPSTVEEYHVLSPRAPLAEALFGRREGDSVSLEVVKGFQVAYEVLKVRNSLREAALPPLMPLENA
jgi:DNA-binding CsgD family transcriptional regulator